MTSAHGNDLKSLPAPIYPAFCYKASPTYDKWVKLTATDVHALVQEHGFEGQNVFFHLNHPIRYVYLCGPVVAIDFVSSRYVFITLDDSSGANIEIKIERIIPPKPPIRPESIPAHAVNNHLPSKATMGEVDDTEEAKIARKHEAGDPNFTRYNLIPDLIPLVTDTTISNVKVVSRCSDPQCYAPHITIDDEILDTATVIKAKGSLQLWNSSFQIKLERVMTVDSIDEEVRIWEEYAQFSKDVLAKPWQLTSKDVERLENEDKEKAKRAHERGKRREAKRILYAEKKRAYDLKEAQREAEAERKRQEQREELDGNALDQLKPWKGVGERAQHIPSLPKHDHAVSEGCSATKKRKNKRERKAIRKRRQEVSQ